MVTTEKARRVGARKRVLLVDDDPVFMAVLHAIVEKCPGVEFAGECQGADEALAHIKICRPDVIVVDWLMPGMNGVEFIREVRSLGGMSGTLVLLCTAHPNRELAGELFALGVNGYIDKAKPFSMIEAALLSVLGGGLFFASDVGPVVPGTRSPFGGLLKSSAAPLDVLSKREREVASLVAGGMNSKEIAARLGVAQRTVESHRANLMRKIRVSDVASLTRWAIQVGIIVV